MTLNDPETSNAKWNRAVRFLLADLETADEHLRALAHDEKFYNELMWVRRDVIEHLHTLWRPEE